MTSSGRSSFTAVHTISATHLPEDGSHSPFDKKPMSSNQTLTFYEYRSDDLSTGRKTRFGTITSSFMRFKTNNREFLAEFMGTLILVLLICGTSAEEVLGIGVNRSWLTSSLGSGLSVLIAICVAGHVSGGHLNPAVTITFWAFSGFPTKKVPIYFAAQYLGAFCGAAILYTMIEPAISQFDHGERQILGELGTASIFGTYPPLYVGIGSAIASEVIGTALLLLVIMVTGHPNNMPFRTAQGVMIAAGIMTISLGLGYTSGFSINPARDLGPRLFTAIGGWGFEVFSIHHYYALVPMFAPFLGGLLGGLVFTIFID
ncbi:aquaporin-like protein [Gilbertella persicaria]|uniref:aquaporin-like protein n=1 Tax=Gilbertella persicaria TaxID=101096 RepID=UPI002221016A|nr:aquaporin-like protein [Gilbertella persicaria]KAI8078075.1 aquaporin-like protein [Gilbertella persicaria]